MNKMEAFEQKLYLELRKSRTELMMQLSNSKGSPLVKPLIEEELRDINSAIQKLENGTFGRCEISGELLPYELLQMVPTLKTVEDCGKLEQYLCKPLF
jgi:hypothetical protein